MAIFFPDHSRSGLFVDAGPEVQQTSEYVDLVSDDDLEVTHKHEQPELAAPDEQNSDTGSSTDESAAETGANAEMVNPPKIPGDARLFQHAKTRMLHLMKRENNRVFLCGRMAGERHAVPERSQLRWDTPCCNRCWKAAGESLGPRVPP